MSKLTFLQTFFSDRLTAVAVEISMAVEKVFLEYQDEISRSTAENQRLQRLLDSVFNPNVILHKAEPPQLTLTVSGDEVPSDHHHSERDESDQEDKEFFISCVESDIDPDSSAPEGIQPESEGDDGLSESPSAAPLTQIKPLKIKRMGLKKSQSSYVCTEGKTSQQNEPPTALTRKRSYSCNECTATYDRPCHLETHKRTHTGEKPYECTDCGKRFNRKHCLHVHMLTHTGEKPHCCHYCGKCFALNTRLIDHLRIHTGEKPYKCPFCARCFTFPSHLSRHKKIHTGERPFQCNICGKCYTRKEHLTDHMRSHTGTKPYSCKLCDKSYALQGNLRLHMASHTGGNHAHEEQAHSCLVQTPLQ
ncbi:hypothetical protein DPEC_G00343490 [Dallia pectoralis]|uniref:Uncharacterized protein n=1 Tax=Dallia pectoralis TaxID=75939 RepID=A0ACC2F355_DALPE|nr:hypothetical protein DPEC_G00343490 [Dallia pectoralis]